MFSKRGNTVSEKQVPSYRTHELFDKQQDICVCIFVLNEGERIQTQLKKMAHLAGIVDIIVADGGSCDGSLTDEILKANQVRTLLTKTGQGKLSAQMRMAFDYALLEDYQSVITMDGNKKDDPNAIPAFVEALRGGYDHIQGSRYIKGGEHANTPWSRYLGVKFLHAPLISLASGFHYTDTTNGFRGYSRQFLADKRVAPLRAIFEKYELHYYLAIIAAKLKFKVCELPVTRNYPKGNTPTKIRGLKGNLEILATLIKACSGKYNTHPSHF